MSVEVVCCFEDDSTEHARELMAEHGLCRLPVIDRDHHLVGIINRRRPSAKGRGTSRFSHRRIVAR